MENSCHILSNSRFTSQSNRFVLKGRLFGVSAYSFTGSKLGE
jgi:hypothetical protein